MNALQIVVISAIVASAAAANPTGRRLFSSGSASAYGSGSSSAYGSAYASAAGKPATKSTCGDKCAYKVAMAFTMPGVSATDFQKPKVVTAFKNTMAAQLGLASSQITNVKAVAARRSAGAKVTFDILVKDKAAADKQKTAATTFLSGGTFVSAFKAEATKQGVDTSVLANAKTPTGVTATSKVNPISGASSLKPALVLPALLAAAYLY